MIIVASIIKKGHYHVVNKGRCVASIRTYGLLKKLDMMLRNTHGILKIDSNFKNKILILYY